MRRIWASLSSLRVQIVLIVLIAWLAPTLVLGISIPSVYFPALREKTEAALATRAEHLALGVRDTVNRLITQAKDATYDGDLTQAFSRYQTGGNYQAFYKVALNYLERRYARNPYVRYAAFFPVKWPEQFLFTKNGYPRAMFFQAQIQPAIRQLGETLDTACRFAYRDGGLFLVRNLHDSRLERFGMLILSIDEERLLAPLMDGADEWGAQAAVRLDEYESRPGIGWDALSPGLSHQNGDLDYVVGAQTRDYILSVLVRQPKALLYKGLDWFMRALTVLLLSLVPVCALVLLYVHRRVVRPITLLSEATARIERGELGITVPMRGTDELGQLGNAFSAMSLKLAHLVDTVYKEEIALRDAQISAMQSRINPHFLNNALELINWQARMDGENAICAMVDALSVLMNAALDRSEKRMVKLREELSIADAYFYFLSQRFGDRVALAKQVDEALLETPIPRLVIQTLLENAAEHGIAPAGGGRIELNARREGGELVLEAVNDGKRPAPDTLEAVARMIEEGNAGPGGHVGLANVRERLQLIYMGRASVRLYLNEAGDTVAEIRLPIECDF